MLRRIRDIINKNQLYAWMIVFVIFVQAYGILVYTTKPVVEKEPALTREEFKFQLEKRKEAMQNLLQKDPQLALNLGYLSLFMFAIFIAGCVFFADYTIKKLNNTEAIPRTLDGVTPLWGIEDLLKIVIIFIFFNCIFSIWAHILSRLASSRFLDRRANMVASTSLVDILIFLFVLRFVISKYKQPIRALGISAKSLLKNIALALYNYVGFLPVLTVAFIAVIFVAKALNYSPAPEPIYELLFEEKRPFLLAIISILVSLIGPVVEEVFFRGFLYGALKKRFNIWWAIFISAFLFSLLHTNVIGFLPILTLGIFLAYLREKTGSLIPSITVHVIHNTALAALMFLARELTSKAM